MHPEGEPMTGTEVATGLIVAFAPTLRLTMAETGDDWQEGITCVVERAVCLAYGFTVEEAREFIRTLLERID